MSNISNKSVDEIDFLKIINLLLKRKIWIFVSLILTSLAAYQYAVSLDNIYLSRAILKPTDSDSLKSDFSKLQSLTSSTGFDFGFDMDGDPYYLLEAIVEDDYFIANFVKKNGFENRIFDDYETLIKDSNFKDNYTFHVSKAVKLSTDISEEKGSNFIILSFENKDRFFTKIFLDKFLTEASERYREISLESINQQIEDYKLEILNTKDISVKTYLSSIVAELIQKKILARAQKYYNFSLIIEPVVPDSMAKVRPRRSLVCIVILVTSFVITILLILLFEWFKSLKLPE